MAELFAHEDDLDEIVKKVDITLGTQYYSLSNVIMADEKFLSFHQYLR